MKIKISLIILCVVFFLNGCAKETTVNIDSFIENYNLSTQNKINKEDFVSYVLDTEISYCLYIDDILLTIASEQNSQSVKRINLSCNNSVKSDLNELAVDIITVTSECDISKAEEITNALEIKKHSQTNNFYKSYIFEKKLTYGFISTDIGNMFYVNFNEIDPVVPTEIPIFQENYTLSETWD